MFAILGIGFWIIFFATLYGFLKLALVFSPLYRGLLITFPHANLPTQFVQPPLWYKLYAYISLVFPAFFLLVGIGILQTVGFCTQNLVCVLAKLAIR